MHLIPRLLLLSTTILPLLFASLASPQAVINLAPGGDLQTAVNSAPCGARIILQADADYVRTVTLPNKSCTEYISIESSRYAEIPVRSFYSQTPSVETAKLMPRLRSGHSTEPVFAAAPGAHHYRFLGLDVAPPNTGQATRIIELGTSGTTQDTPEEIPHHFEIDKSWIHGWPSHDVQRCVALNSDFTTITNSWITDCHGRGYDTQAIGGWNGGSNQRIINNALNGAGENYMMGGAHASVQGLIPTGIEFRRNYVWKPLSWYVNDLTYAGIHWTVKNLFELKNARAVIVEGNVFEGNWTDAQAGRAIVFTPRPSDSGSWAVVEDVQFINNIVRSVGSGVNILGHDEPPAPTDTRLKRLRVANNLFENIDGPRFGSNGAWLTITSGAEDVVVERNTVLHNGAIIIADYDPNIRFIYRNNISRHNEYGIFGSGVGIGNQALVKYFPGAVVTGNAMVREVNAPGNVEQIYPAGNLFPSSLSVAIDVNFRSLISGVGADIDAINAALGGATTPLPTPTPTPVNTPSPSPSPSPSPAVSPSPSPSPIPTPTPTPTPTPSPSPTATPTPRPSPSPSPKKCKAWPPWRLIYCL